MPLSSSQIISLSLQIAKCPGFTAQAGQMFSAMLSDLCQDYDLYTARGVAAFNFNSAAGNQSGPYTLPADWLRANRNDVFYTIQGVKYVMIGVELAEFDALVQQAGLNSYPENYALDNSAISTGGAPVMYVWPPPSGSFPVTARYFRQMPEIDTPESSSDIPWFNNTNYMITRLACEMMKITNDDRQSDFGVKADNILRHYLQSGEEVGDVVHTVTLDRRRFGENFNRLPNTKLIGW